MKKRRMIAAAALIVILLLTGAWCVRGIAPITSGDTQMRRDGGEDFVRAAVRLEEGGTLRAEQTFYLTNRSGEALEEIALRVPANGIGYCSVMPESASVNGDMYEAEYDEDDVTLLRIDRPWTEGEAIELTLSLAIALSPDADPAVVSLPVIAQRQMQPWDALAGMTNGPAMDGYLDVDFPQAYETAFSGAAGHIGAPAGSQKGARQAVVHLSGARDMTFAVSKDACVRWRKIGGVAVSAMGKDLFEANRLLSVAAEALSSLEKAGLAYPFPALTIVSAQPVSAEGDVYSGLIVVSADAKEETLVRRMTRLIARQTFGVLVGHDGWQEPWLGVSLASAAELLAFRERKGEAAYEARFLEEIEVATRLTRPYGVTVGADIWHFGGDAEMTQVLRDQGAAMLLGIERAVGRDAFIAALRRYAEENAHGFADRAVLESAFEKETGSNWHGYFEDELAY